MRPSLVSASFLTLPGCEAGFSFLLLTILLFFLTGHFPQIHKTAEEAIRFQRDLQGVVGSGTDPQVAWTFPEIVSAAEACLRVLGN